MDIVYLNHRINLYNSLIPVNATVNENSIALNNQHSLSLQIKTKEYKRTFEIRYVLLSWRIGNKMQVKEGEQIKIYINPKDKTKLNNSNDTLYKNFLNIPMSNIKAYGAEVNNTWRSFSLYKDMIIDIVDMLILSFLLAIAAFLINGGMDHHRIINITLVCCFLLSMLALYILEAV
ncbi:MAG: hypothetical protein JWR38_4104 [Mucilaginibacter sp.]|nr:hypothetical protein [Mucilaginibacter sp.]